MTLKNLSGKKYFSASFFSFFSSKATHINAQIQGVQNFVGKIRKKNIQCKSLNFKVKHYGIFFIAFVDLKVLDIG